LDNEIKPQDAHGKFSASFIFGPQFTEQKMYQFFMGRSEVSGTKELWSSGAPLKHKIHMWLALKDRLWTVDRLEECGMHRPQLCALCCQEKETIKHLTPQCSYSREIWHNMLLPLHLQHHTPTAESIMALWWPALAEAVTAWHRKELNSLVVLVARELWLERNARVFDRTATMPGELCRRIRAELELWKIAALRGGGSMGGIT
jgi:hypothetical protein